MLSTGFVLACAHGSRWGPAGGLARHTPLRVVDQANDVTVRVVQRDQAPRGNVEGGAIERKALGLECLVRRVHALHLEPHARAASTGARRGLGEEQVRMLGKLEVRYFIRRGRETQQAGIPLARGLRVTHPLQHGLNPTDTHGWGSV
jgi:hypothetical protein